MTYARSRLWLGITSVGSLVVLASLAWSGRIPSRVLPNESVDFVSTVMYLSLAFGAYVLVSLPFDYIGGHHLPRKYGRVTTGLSHFFRRWLRGILVQGGWSLLLALSILWVAGVAGPWWTVAVVGAAGFVLLLTQSWIAQSW